MLLVVVVYQLSLSLRATRERVTDTIPNPGRAHLAWAIPAGMLLGILVTLLLLPTSSASTQSRPVDMAAATPVNDGEVSLILAGDVMLSRNVARSIAESGQDFRYPFQATAPLTSAASIAFCNLECPISGRGEAIAKRYLFNAPPESVDGLAFAGFDVVSLANNHVLDYGPIALEDTQRHLSRVGIAAVGISTQQAPQNPVILVRNGVRIGFLAYADPESPYGYAKEFGVFETGPAKAIEAVVAADIEDLKRRADVIVVSVHWGTEYVESAEPRQKTLGRFFVDQGADLVVGHHPHVLQETEWYQAGLILYSLGNFVFDQHSRPPTRISRLYRILVTDKGIERAEFIPLEIARDWQPRPNSPQFQLLPR
jgi:poly-gamma-glutamate synthesis protein (capsule biosynthesis protein)